MARSEAHLSNKLNERKARSNQRVLPPPVELVDFVSNDYLGLARDWDLRENIWQEVENLDARNGSTGSRLLSGNTKYAQNLESILASTFGAEAALLCNSGYVANLAVLSSVPQRGDTILYDELSHASIKDGIRLSPAARFSFRHNDRMDLERKLKKAKGQKYIVAETIYSMDGDQCPCNELVILADDYDAHVIIDEAHSTGVIGANGSGLLCHLGLENETFARIYTFGKGMGVHGAVICGSRSLIDYLINFARPFIYTTALPDHSLVAIKCAFDFIASNVELQQQLQLRVDHFLTSFDEIIGNKVQRVASASAIQALVFPGNENARSTAEKLREAGFDVLPILSPTVKEGQERLRISLHTYNSNDEITGLIESMGKLV